MEEYLADLPYLGKSTFFWYIKSLLERIFISSNEGICKITDFIRPKKNSCVSANPTDPDFLELESKRWSLNKTPIEF